MPVVGENWQGFAKVHLEIETKSYSSYLYNRIERFIYAAFYKWNSVA